MWDAPNKTEMTIGVVILLKSNSLLDIVALASIGFRWLLSTHRARRHDEVREGGKERKSAIVACALHRLQPRDLNA